MRGDLSTTTGLLARISFPKLSHPIRRGPWRTAFPQREANHRVSTQRSLLLRGGWGASLAVEPGEQLDGLGLVERGDPLHGQFNGAHVACLRHWERSNKIW